MRRGDRNTFECVVLKPTSSINLFHYAYTSRVRAMHPRYHYHPEIELTFFVRGRGLRFVGDSIQPFGAGDLCLLEPNLLHFWHTGEELQSVEAIGVHIRAATLAGAAEQWPEFRRLRELPGLCRRGVRIDGGQAEIIVRDLTEAAAMPEGSSRRLTAVLRAFDAACDPAGHHPLSATSAAAPQADRVLSRFARVIEALHAEMPTPPDQAAMASLIGMTPAAFSRFFKQCMGRGYTDYVNAWRVGLACRQLLQTDLPITQIAFDCGFENLSNFHRRFRHYKQTTPHEYRAAALSNPATHSSPHA